MNNFYYGRTNNILSLYSSSRNQNEVYICANKKDMDGAYLWSYKVDDSDALKVDKSKVSIDSSKEVLC